MTPDQKQIIRTAISGRGVIELRMDLPEFKVAKSLVADDMLFECEVADVNSMLFCLTEKANKMIAEARARADGKAKPKK